MKSKKLVKKASLKKPSDLSEQAKRLKHLEALNQSKSEFVAAVSHELRTPLAIIKQLVLLMYDGTAGPINDKQREILVKSRHNIDRLKNMIDNLLDISVMERNALNLRYSLVNLNHMIRDSRNFFKHKAQEKNILLAYNLPREDISVFVDAERILQVITNLLNNAIKFTPNNKSITIEIKLIGANIRIGVIDTGIGMEKSDIPKVFEKFAQVTSNVESSKGIGMGLSIVKELVEKHGGQVWAESTLGKGTKFYFTLPRYYTAHLTSLNVIKKINKFLDKKISVYVVNVLVVNYAKFKQRMKIDTKKLSRDLRLIVVSTMKLFFPIFQVEQGEFVSDTRTGRYSVIFPNQPAGNINKFCKFLKEEIKGYFLEHDIDEAFIALGISTLSSKAHIKAAEEGSPSIMVRELYIGSEMRKHKRIKYKTKLEVHSSHHRKEEAQIIDMSQGGLCFVSALPLQIDTELHLKFKLLKKKKIINTKARVAWLEKVKSLPDGRSEQVKVGAEFHGMPQKDSKLLDSELRLYYE